MNEIDKNYKNLVNYIFDNGIKKKDRTGVGTTSVFGYQTRFNLQNGFPLLSLRKIHTRSLIHELLWFLESYDKEYNKFGNTNIKYLIDNGVTFWTEWPYEYYKKEQIKKYQNNDLKDEKTIKKLKILSQKEFENKIKKDDNFALDWGDLGPIYGKQWKDWGGYNEQVEMKNEYNRTKSNSRVVSHQGWKNVKIAGIDQISNLIDQLETNPDSRRLMISSWNVEDIDDMLLPPCHVIFQLYTFQMPNENKRRISLQLYQRSADVGLGVPYNIASYSILLHMIANIVDMIPHEFIYTLGDAHIYENHKNQMKEILSRQGSGKEANLKLNKKENITEYRDDDFNIVNYDPHPNIKMQVAV